MMMIISGGALAHYLHFTTASNMSWHISILHHGQITFDRFACPKVHVETRLCKGEDREDINQKIDHEKTLGLAFQLAGIP